MGREGTIHLQHPDGSGLVAIGPDEEIPDWARELVHPRHLGEAAVDDDADEEGGGEFDPSEHNVEEVNTYLAGEGVSDDEKARVVAAEKGGKARAGIVVNGPHAPSA